MPRILDILLNITKYNQEMVKLPAIYNIQLILKKIIDHYGEIYESYSLYIFYYRNTVAFTLVLNDNFHSILSCFCFNSKIDNFFCQLCGNSFVFHWGNKLDTCNSKTNSLFAIRE